MLFPDKHITVSESLIGLGSLVLELLTTPSDVDALHVECMRRFRTAQYPSYHSFENLVLALDFLFAVGAIMQDRQGRISKCG